MDRKRDDAERWMRLAVAEARRGVRAGDGGPFGAVLVCNGQIIARGHNRVIASNDPTAHAEIVALRRASHKLGRFHLPDCTVYTTCEPCPMCLAAMHWARIKVFYFGCDRRDAARIGFADKDIYDALAGRPVKGAPLARPLLREACLGVFAEWAGRTNKVLY
ncbi:MAG: nucleoside deaminase [Candidatus Aminicenantes bacterium]|nr:nucleoside deaminase [Candidatus Aminicenantes bacterium]